MSKLYKVNTIASVVNISIFIIQFLLIAFSDFRENKGATKDVAIFSYLFLYFWLIIPPVLGLILSNYRKKRKVFDLVILFLNTVIFIYNFPMFISYLQSV